MTGYSIELSLPDKSKDIRPTRNWRKKCILGLNSECIPRWTCLSILTPTELAMVRDGKIYVVDSIGRIIRPEDVIEPHMVLKLVPGNQDKEEARFVRMRRARLARGLSLVALRNNNYQEYDRIVHEFPDQSVKM